MNSLRVDKAAKHLQEESNYAKYDVDGDGIVTDEELKTIHAINAEVNGSEENVLGSYVFYDIFHIISVFTDLSRQQNKSTCGFVWFVLYWASGNCRRIHGYDCLHVKR